MGYRRHKTNAKSLINFLFMFMFELAILKMITSRITLYMWGKQEYFIIEMCKAIDKRIDIFT